MREKKIKYKGERQKDRDRKIDRYRDRQIDSLQDVVPIIIIIFSTRTLLAVLGIVVALSYISKQVIFHVVIAFAVAVAVVGIVLVWGELLLDCFDGGKGIHEGRSVLWL